MPLRATRQKAFHALCNLREHALDTTSPTVSIIIPCRNERANIDACLRSILAQEPPPGGFEVIVADGMSDDGTRDILAALATEQPHVRVIDNLGRIVSTALNAGLAIARGPIIIRMDAHTEYASDYVRQCVAVLQETHADNVGGPWVAKGNGFVGEAIARVFHSPFAVGGALGHDVAYEGRVDTVYLGCWPRQVFERVGRFDEELVRNQDDEFNLRLTRAGGTIWQSPRIRSWYAPRNSLRVLFSQYRQYGYWKVRVIQKHRIPASIRHLVPGAFMWAVVALPLLGLWWPAAMWAWLALVVLYGCGTLTASLAVAADGGWRLLPILPLVFLCYHVAYGCGFLHGIWDLVIWRRQPRSTYGQLTRSEEPSGLTQGNANERPVA